MLPGSVEALNAAIDFGVSGALGLTFRRLGATVAGLRGRRYKDDLDIGEWFDTDLLVDRTVGGDKLLAAVPALTALDETAADKLSAVLRSTEVQAALQRLLAARLTGVAGQHVDLGVNAFRDTLLAAGSEFETLAAPLASYLDAELERIVDELHSKKPEVLRQIRGDAIAMQMLSVLVDNELRLQALEAPPSPDLVAGFVANYRTKVEEEFRQIDLPDVEKRQVDLARIYVSSQLSECPDPANPERLATPGSQISLRDAAALVDRLVILGDPGSGKTTATRVLMHRWATSAPAEPAAERVPFLVELRQYGLKLRDNTGLPADSRSILGFIAGELVEHSQFTLPAGLVRLLLLTSRAIVIFDGLDELLDLATRREVARRIDNFCAEYPQARVLVTARTHGYSQAMLRDPEFTCFQLNHFGDDQVADYARRWFSLDSEAGPGQAAAFIEASRNFPDLRANPLLLSLMCFLFRGYGELPWSPVEIYDNCAKMMLIFNWDKPREFGPSLRARKKVMSTLAYLAWHIFTQSTDEYAVTEDVLIIEARNYLQNHGFSETDDATEAAEEFVAYCQGRAWIFREAGRSGSKRLYGFRHRIFQDYFAACYLSGMSRNPEDLAVSLMEHVPQQDDWWPVGSLAIQMKNSAMNQDGASSIFATMLDLLETLAPGEKSTTLRFLVHCLRWVADDVEGQLRRLTAEIIGDGISSERVTGAEPQWMRTLEQLMAAGSNPIIADEVSKLISAMVGGASPSAAINGLWFTASLRNASVVPHTVTDTGKSAQFWVERADALLRAHSAKVAETASEITYLRQAGLQLGILSAEQALEMPGGFHALLETPDSFFPQDSGVLLPYLQQVCAALRVSWTAYADRGTIPALESIGDYLLGHQPTPWLVGEIELPLEADLGHGAVLPADVGPAGGVSSLAYLGAAALLAMLTEHDEDQAGELHRPRLAFGPGTAILPYLERRLNRGAAQSPALPELPVPEEFRPVFRNWARGAVDFTAPEIT